MYGRWPATGIPAYHDEAKPGVYFQRAYRPADHKVDLAVRLVGHAKEHGTCGSLFREIQRQPPLRCVCRLRRRPGVTLLQRGLKSLWRYKLLSAGAPFGN